MFPPFAPAYHTLPSCLFFFVFSATLLFSILHLRKRTAKPACEDFPTAPRDPWLGSFAFFRAPLAFLNRVRDEGGHRGFWILGHRVVMVRGLAGCETFFSKGLDFMAGYRLLNPQLVDIMPATEIKGDESWASFMATFVRSEVLERMMPTMVDDMTRVVETWGTQGTLDPFDEIYEIVFLLSARLATCSEFCADRTKLRALMRIFANLEAGSTPSSLVLSWVPTPARVRRFLAGARLFKMISDVVRARKAEGRREEDPLQVLIDRGFTLTEITRFIAMTLFAAVTNTGNVFCWFMIYAELSPEWKSRIQSEIDTFVEAHSPATAQLGTLTSNAAALINAGPDALERATPLLNAALHETIRTAFNGFLMRRNTGAPRALAPTHTVPAGAFLFFPTADVHLNPALYPAPAMFDPARFLPDAAAARAAAHPAIFLGWGAGRHVCVGRRAALLMMSAVAVVVLGAFEVSVEDESGKRLDKVPQSREDALFKVGRSVERVRVRYRRRVDERT